MLRRRILSQAAGVLGGAAILCAVSAQAAPPITVTVNGTPVTFSGTPPTEIHNAVLVPLRGVFQALNATVRYDAPSKTIYAQKGAASVILPLGASTATVNGQPQALSQPAQTVNGTTLVPLRFVAQALGAYVQWHANTSTVEIKTSEPHLASLPTAPGTGPVEGQVTGVYANTVPQTLTVRINGQDTSVPLTAQTIILRSEAGQPATEVSLTQLTPGDEVRVQRDAQGNAVSVTATFGEIIGTVKTISRLPNGDPVLTLNDGKAIELTPGAPITMGGRRIGLVDVLPNEKVVIRTNPSNSLGYGVALATGGATPVPPGAAPIMNPAAPANVPAGGLPAGATPTVTAFSVDATKALRAGDVLTATLTGTPGGQASFSIPGVADNVPMHEGAAGVYTGTFSVPRNVSVAGAAVLGKVMVNGVSSPLIQAAHTVTLDSVPPRITQVSPVRDATVESDRPLIYATVSDNGGTGVDPNATKLFLDGTDVTALATVTPAFVSFKPNAPLSSGRHTVRLALADGAGNTATTDWAFTVSTHRLIQSFTSDAPGGTIAAGTPIRFSLTATPGGHASVRLGSRSVPLTERQPGVYTGTYTVQPGDNAAQAPVVASFTAPDGTKVTAPLKTNLNLAGGAPAAPIITSPASGATVGNTLTVAGTAAPGATVQVQVTFTGKALGGLVPLSGSLANEEVTADTGGHWVASNISLRANSLFGEGSGTVFTITATAVDAAGDQSQPTSVQVQRK